MITKMAFWRMLVTIPFLILALAQPAAGQGGKGTSEAQEATRFDYTKSHAFPNLLAPYLNPYVPRPRLDNSRRLQNLIVDGKLVLTLEDAIALAIENNLDVEVARYDVPIAQSDFLRTKGGGAARGAAGAFQSTSLFAALWAQVGPVEQAEQAAREAPREAASTSGEGGPAATRAYTRSTAGAMPSRP